MTINYDHIEGTESQIAYIKLLVEKNHIEEDATKWETRLNDPKTAEKTAAALMRQRERSGEDGLSIAKAINEMTDAGQIIQKIKMHFV